MLWVLVLMKSPETFLVPMGLVDFKGFYATNWGVITAASFLAVIPILLVFIALHKYFIKGLGAVEDNELDNRHYKCRLNSEHYS